MKKIFTLLLLTSFFIKVQSQSTTVVISMVYSGGGSSTATVSYKRDFIELHNISTTTQSLDGLSLQYGSATGNLASAATNFYVFPTGTSIPAGGYLLIQCGSTGSGGADLPTSATPDILTTNISMAGATGKIALINGTTAFAPTCGATANPCTLPNANIIDFVAYGALSSQAEGGASVNNNTALNINQASLRNTFGCAETNNNNADFAVVDPAVVLPRNSVTTPVICTAGLSVNTNNIYLQKMNNSIKINFTKDNNIEILSYEIEKLTKNKTWELLENIKNTVNNYYSIIDNNPTIGLNTYRIKSNYSNNKIEYSVSKSLNYNNKNTVSITPNPTTNAVTITLNKAINTITIINSNGNIIANQKTNNNTFVLNTSAYTKGVYYIKINDGTTINTEKLIVQ